MKCPYPEGELPRWLKELRYEYASNVGPSLANAIFYLANLADVDKRARPLLEELRSFERRFKDLYDTILCELMGED